MEKRPALGKGLSALIPDAADALTAPPRASLEVDVDQLEPNHYQPRGPIDAGRLDELARSIKANGIIQPIVVRRLDGPMGGRERYQIIAGERRWRAAQQAELARVPIVVKDVPPADKKRLLEMALIENIQREDLNPMEAAAAYQRLADEFHLKQDDIAVQVGKDRATVANYLRLLKLPEEVRGNVASGALSMGHARAIVALTSESDPASSCARRRLRGLSVRETEALVKKEIAPSVADETPPQPKKDVHTRAAEEQAAHLARHAVTDQTQGQKAENFDRVYQRERTSTTIRYLTERK
jgi:ParB family chromosome partitioning protein